jgi:hypothetical protein
MAAGKICAIVGNGFSIDFIEKLKLGHAIRLRGSLIPCPLVFDRDKWNGPWDPPDFQAHRSLHNEWNRLGMPALPENEAWWRFCELLSLDNIAPLGSTFDLIRDQKRYRLIPAGYWGKPFPPGYDLRLYLWRLFATYDRIVLEQLVNQHRDVPQRMKYLEQLPLARCYGTRPRTIGFGLFLTITTSGWRTWCTGGGASLTRQPFMHSKRSRLSATMRWP